MHSIVVDAVVVIVVEYLKLVAIPIRPCCEPALVCIFKKSVERG
jgi:hypothetical protein